MGQFKQEDVAGLVRNNDKTHTAVLKNGERRVLDACETSALERRLDKDRSRMEREGTRANEKALEREYEANRRYDPDKRAQESRERDQRLRNDLARKQPGDRR